MNTFKSIVAVVIATAGLATTAMPTAAQQVIGFQPGVGPICTGPHGVAPCAVIQQWLAQQGGAMQQHPQAMPWGGPAPNLGGLPGAGLFPQDGQIVATIAQGCGGQPVCMAAAWGSVELERCRNGFGVPGGCFGPNGEIMRIINQVVPEHLRPNVIVENIQKDLRNGPGDSNDLVGKDGWLRKRLGF